MYYLFLLSCLKGKHPPYRTFDRGTKCDTMCGVMWNHGADLNNFVFVSGTCVTLIWPYMWGKWGEKTKKTVRRKVEKTQNPNIPTCCFVLNLSLTHHPLLLYLHHHVAHLILHRKHLWRQNINTRPLYIYSAAVTDHLCVCDVCMIHSVCVLCQHLPANMHVVSASWAELRFISPPKTHDWLRVSLFGCSHSNIMCFTYTLSFWSAADNLPRIGSTWNMCLRQQRTWGSSAVREDLLLLLRSMCLISVGINQTCSMWLLLATKWALDSTLPPYNRWTPHCRLWFMILYSSCYFIYGAPMDYEKNGGRDG